jgi:uncharacterized phage-like protein YoqJ
MRLGVVGSRDFPNRFLVEETVRRIAQRFPKAVLVSGGARGVDTWAAEAGRACGLQVIEHSPDYDTHGKGAPLERNTTIVEDSDALLAFWDQRSRGTLDTLRKAKERGKNIRIVLSDGSEPIVPPV